MSVSTKIYANMSAEQRGKRLDGERLGRIVEAKTVEDALKMLGDYGFACVEAGTVDKFIVAETNRLIELIDDVSPSKKLANVLNARFWYNNVKLAYKSRFTEVPSDGFYDTPWNAQAIAEGDYSEADRFLTAALEDLDERKSKSPQDIDLCLTRAMYRYVLSIGIPAVKKYFRAEIDMKNILSAARMKKLNIKIDEFLDGGSVSREQLNEAVSGDNFAEPFENGKFEEYASTVARSDELWRAERDADDYLYYMTDEQVKRYSSYTPFINFYTESLIELKTVKTALVCIKTNSRDMFYSRMPKLYER